MHLLKRRRERQQERIQKEICNALDSIRPMLRIEECALTLFQFDPDTGVTILEGKGGCPGCDLSVATFLQGIETQLKLRVPEITSVRLS